MRLFAALGLVLTLAACSGGGSGSSGSIGSLNPFTWFGAGKAAPSDTAVRSLAPRRGYIRVIDTRPLIDQITGLSVDRTPGGVIVRATGLPPSQGYYNADLVQVASPNAGELAFEFRISPPPQAPRIGTVWSREIVTGTFLSDARLTGIRRFRVSAARNERTVRR